MWSIFNKDLSLLLADRKAVILKFVLPIVLISVFVSAFAGMREDGRGGTVRQVYLPVVDLDSSAVSKYVIAQLDSAVNLRIERVTLAVGESAVRQGKRAGILVIEAGFGNAHYAGQPLPWELIYQAGREMEMSILQSILGPQLRDLERRQQVATVQFTAQQREEPSSASASSAGGERLPTRPLTAEALERNDPWLVQPVAGIAIILLLFNVTGLGSSILEEKESGTLPRLLQALPRPEYFFGAKLLFGAMISAVQLSIMLLFAHWVFGLKLGLNPGLLIAVIIGLIYACSAFGLLLASWSRTRAQMQGLSIGGILLMSAIGGSMIPIFIMPEFMQNLAMFSINYWGLEGFYDILWRQSEPAVVWPKIAVLFGIGTVLLSLAYFFYRRNLARLLG